MSKGKLPSYDAQNLEHARRVLADPERWGEGQVQWAQMVVERLEPQMTLSRQAPDEGKEK